ncbi:MerR family transcriptional regulator [Carnobacterium funditum]|uniref:MerR family transcriptional regulator n=1 Tax=Carnobacterium funditum TaxID=2752 RepID=UPI000550CE6D|nr:MerR family transcriptional regulator [Carnobacterium funditum]
MKEIHPIDYVSTRIVCERLMIQPSTLRKYASLLDEKAEKDLYFARDESNNRLYTKEDIATLQLLVDLKNKPGYTLDIAVNEILGFRHNSDTTNAIATETDANDFSAKLRLIVAQQNKYLDDYQEALQKKDVQIERLEKLVDSLVKHNIDIISDSNKISEESKTPLEEPKELEKKSFFKRIFGKFFYIP